MLLEGDTEVDRNVGFRRLPFDKVDLVDLEPGSIRNDKGLFFFCSVGYVAKRKIHERISRQNF